MKQLKRVLAALLSVVLIFTCFVGCGKNVEETDSTLEGFDSLIEGTESDGEFDNTDEDDPVPTPGSYGTGVYKTTASQKGDTKTDDTSEGEGTLAGEAAVLTTAANTVPKATTLASSVGTNGTALMNTTDTSEADDYQPDFEPSLLDDEESLEFYYEGNSYAYGITADGEEVIAYREKGKEKIDVLAGGGKFSIATLGGYFLTNYRGIENYKRSLKNGYIMLTVTYDMNDENVKIETSYVFKEDSISVTSKLDYVGGSGTIKSNSAIFRRDFMNDYESVEKRLNYEWSYPDNGAHPRPLYDSIVTTVHLDERHKVYSFNRDSQAPDSYNLSNYPDIYFPLHISEDKDSLLYIMEYDIVLETVTEEKDEDYEALFKGNGSEIAVGVTPVLSEEEYDNTTVFRGNEVTLNLNVTNVSQDDVIFSLRYDIMDYYGNIVDSGIFINSTVFYGISANRHVKVSGGNGIYYLNLYAMTSTYKHHECYPFILLGDYDYQYTSTNPFGIDAAHYNTVEHGESTTSLLNKIGAAFTREGNSPDNNETLYKGLKEEGIQIVAATGGAADQDANTIYSNVTSNINRIAADKDKYTVRYAVISNEPDYPVKGNLDACRELLENTILPKVYNPLKDIVRKSGVKVAWCATCHANYAMSQAMYEYGVWAATDVIDTHMYCASKGPDKSFHSSANVDSIEWELQRLNDSIKEYGAEDKLISVGETGYAINSVDLRTQADFCTRTGILCMAYGVDSVGFYCMFDRTGYYEGTGVYEKYGTSAEYNYGMFYNYDYFGVFKPKPWVAAFANLSKQFDGIESCSINEELTTDTGEYLSKGTMRVFDASTKLSGNFKIAWSNIYRVARSWSADVGSAQAPIFPWKSQWLKTEPLTLNATGDVVTVVDLMGNATEYTPVDGKVTIEISGSPVYIYGVE